MHEDHTLQVTPEVRRNRTGTKHTLKAKIDPMATAAGVQIDFEITKGPNDGNDDDALTAPDLTCDIAEGSSSCSVSYKGDKSSGTDRIVAWIDHDRDDATIDADVNEGWDAGATPDEPGCSEAKCGPADISDAGDTPEPDGTDVVIKNWGQMGAGSVAQIDGPINFATKGCDTGKDRDAKGRTVATAKACTFIYLVPQSADLSAERDFGSVWIQSTVDARSGWCARKVKTILQVPEGTQLEDVAPSKPLGLNKRTLGNVTLRVGTTEQMTTVSEMVQTMFLYPDSLELKERAAGNTQKLIWEGRSRKKLSFALGLSLSWDQAAGLPDFSSSSGVLRRELVKRSNC